MANAVHDYAEAVAVALGVAGDAQGTQLLAAADAIDAALDAPATLDAALAQWKSATDGLPRMHRSELPLMRVALGAG